MGAFSRLIIFLVVCALIFGAIAFISSGSAKREEAKAERIYAQSVLTTSQADAFAVRSQASMPYVLLIVLVGVGVLVFLSRQDSGKNYQQPPQAQAPQPQVIILQVPSGAVAALPAPQYAYPPVEVYSQELALVD